MKQSSRFFLVAAATLIAFPALGGLEDASFARCSARIAELARRSLYEGRNPLFLQPNQKRYLVGSLVQIDQGPKVLVLGGYRIRHQHLHIGLDLVADEQGWGQMNYEWLGELEVENSERFATIGRIRKITPVSGYWNTDIHSLLGNRNQSHLLVEALTGAYADLLDPKVKALTYDQAVERGEEHLMKRLQRFLKAFNKGRERGTIPAAETYRHFIFDNIHKVLTAIDNAFEREGTKKERLRAIEAAFEPDLRFESLYLYLSWLENDGVEHPSIDGMRALLRRFEKHHDVPMADWQHFDEMAVRFREHFFGANADQHSLEEWMSFGCMATDFRALLPAMNQDAAKAMEAQVIVLDMPQEP